MLSLVSDALFPPRCLSCGELELCTVNGKRLPFCESCADGILNAAREKCTVCGEPYSVCECAAPVLEAMGVRTVYATFAYDKRRRESPLSAFIYKLKDGKNKAAFAFAAELMENRIRKTKIFSGSKPKDVIVTFAPRRGRAVRDVGVDHMEAIAKLTAERLGVGFMPLFENSGNKAQKTMDAAERFEAALASVQPKKNNMEAVYGKTVILLDDIVTTGATLCACAMHLGCAEVGNVAVCVLAKSVSDKIR